MLRRPSLALSWPSNICVYTDSLLFNLALSLLGPNRLVSVFLRMQFSVMFVRARAATSLVFSEHDNPRIIDRLKTRGQRLLLCSTCDELSNHLFHWDTHWTEKLLGVTLTPIYVEPKVPRLTFASTILSTKSFSHQFLHHRDARKTLSFWKSWMKNI